MKKYMLDMKVTENCSLHKNYCLLKLTSDQILPEMLPGQFVQVTEHAGWLSINRVMLLTSCCLWETVSRCLPIKNKNYC